MLISKKREGRTESFLLCLLWLLLFSGFALARQGRGIQPLDQMIDALGGQAYLDVDDIHTTGRFYAFAHGQLSASDLFADFIKFPDMERTEFGGPKFKTITINSGKQGKKVEGKKDPVDQTPGEVEEFQKGFKTGMDYVLRFVVQDKQTTIQNLGTEMVGFKRTDIIELRDPAKNRIRFYIDRESHLPVKMQVRRSDDPKLHEEQYSNWHKSQGVSMPLFVTRYTDGVKTMEIRAETVVYNSHLADNLFTQLNPSSK
ncbi:MAG TPA: hypothetical protein VGK48_12095 [Terriglobia bacterium]|jgi:hypothetical protein